MTGQATLFGKPAVNDPCRSHHHGDQESVAAFARGNKTKHCALVLKAIRARGDAGAIPDDIADDLSWSLSQVAPRFTNLKFTKDIEDTGDKRPTKLGGSGKAYRAVGPR